MRKGYHFTESVFLILTIGILLIYSILMFYFCIKTEALVPDEIWFYNEAISMKEYSFFELIKMPNKLAYGSIYWIILVLFKNILLIRVFCWICMLSLLICIILIIRKAFLRTWKNIFIAMLLFLSCPMAWFTGKIIGPELVGNAIGAVGATIIFLKKDKKNLSWIYFIGGIFIGLSAGIKLYN